MIDLHRKPYQCACAVLLCIAVATAWLLLSTSKSVAQQATTRWEQPVVLFDASSAASPVDPRILFYPFIVVDTNEHIKILWTTALNNSDNSLELFNALYCIDGDGSDWSSPVDVITDPNGARVDWPQHVVDMYGRLSVVWVGSNARLYLSRTPAAEACDARSWETVLIPASDQVLYGAIDLDAENILHVAYAARGRDIFYMRSYDDGTSWTDPVPVSRVTPDRATAFPNIKVDPLGRIHIVWEEAMLPQGVPGVGLFYSYSEDGGQTWSDPAIFSQAEGEYTQPSLAVLEDNSVHRFWNGRASTRGRYHQWSKDGGKTWSATIEFIPKDMGGGQTGFPRHAIDSSGRLHLVSGTEAVTYRIWSKDQWDAAPRNIMPYLEYPNIVIARGHVLHVVASDFQRIWYIRGITDAPEIAPDFTVLPARPQEASPTITTPRATPTAEAGAPATTLPPELASPPSQVNSLTPILLSSGLAFLVVAAVVAMALGRRRS